AMDFSFTPEQEALRELARRILDDHVTQARLKAVEAEPDGFDRAAWQALAEARLLGVAVPEDTGGRGLGVLDLSLVLQQVGRGVTLERQLATNREPQARLVLDGAPGDALPGADVGWLVERALVGLSAMQLGVTERALRLTAGYTARREQFDRPIASFQAVHQRAADAYIDVEAIRLTTWQAAWRLSAGLPATAEVAVAKFWASEAAHRVVYAAQHLHGGIGVDVDYPLHRYYPWAKQIELPLGSGTRQLG